jgi:hypothetical protein
VAFLNTAIGDVTSGGITSTQLQANLLYANTAVTTLQNNLNSIQANIGANYVTTPALNVAIYNLTQSTNANAAVQQSQIANIDAAISSLQSGFGYVTTGQLQSNINTITSDWTANAVAQQGQLNTLRAAGYLTASNLTPYVTLSAFQANIANLTASGGSSNYYTDSNVAAYLASGTNTTIQTINICSRL